MLLLPHPLQSSNQSHLLPSLSPHQGLCITCEEVAENLLNSDSPTPSPDFETSEFPATPAPAILTAATEAPFGIFPATPAPVAPVAPPTEAPAVPPTEAPVAPATDAPVAAPAPTAEASDCECVNNLSEEEMAVLTRRSKNMVCDPTCSDQSDLVWGELRYPFYSCIVVSFRVRVQSHYYFIFFC